MKKLVAKFKDGTYTNIQADLIYIENEKIMGWDGENLVFIADISEVLKCYLTEKVQ